MGWLEVDLGNFWIAPLCVRVVFGERADELMRMSRRLWVSIIAYPLAMCTDNLQQ
jgi:hypothetical protein